MRKEATTFVHKPSIFATGTELQVSTIVERTPWRPSVERIDHFNQIVFMTVISGGLNDNSYTEKTPKEELKKACIDYFMKICNATEVSCSH